MNYREYVDKLTEICKKKKLKLKSKKLNNDYKFYYLDIGEGNHTIIFSAGIHGDEIAGPHAIIKFLEYGKLPDYRVIIFPVVNPYGFDRQIRANAFRQDINRRFCDKLLAGEAKAVYDIVRRAENRLFVSLHEWYGKDGFYMYASDKIKQEQYEEIPKMASKTFKVMNQKINGETCEDGIIWHPDDGYENADSRSSCTLENKMYSDGVHYLCIETPSKAELDKRVSVQFNIMKFVIDKLIGD